MANPGTRINMLPIKVLDYMAERDYQLSAVKIAEGLGVERKNVTSALQGLKDRKKVVSTGVNKGTMWGLASEPVEIIGLDMASVPVEAKFGFTNGVPQFMELVGHQYGSGNSSQPQANRNQPERR